MLFDDSPPSSLTGIARLAARSPVLEAKSQVRYFEIETRSVLNRTRPGMPFRWTINPYRGCEFACKYCYARYTHEFMGIEDATLFEDQIYAKSNLAPILRQELPKLDPADAIAIGTATDPYQPAERRFRRTRSVLEVFAAGQGRRLSITTKSDLVTRDLDLLRCISQSNVLSINITITTLDRELARMLEPRAPRPDLRLQAVRKLAGAGIRVGVFPNPILPLITDSERRLDQLARAARDHGASSLRWRLALPDARREKSFLSLSGRSALSATPREVPATLHSQRLSARGVCGHAARSGARHPGSRHQLNGDTISGTRHRKYARANSRYTAFSVPNVSSKFCRLYGTLERINDHQPCGFSACVRFHTLRSSLRSSFGHRQGSIRRGGVGC